MIGHLAEDPSRSLGGREALLRVAQRAEVGLGRHPDVESSRP